MITLAAAAEGGLAEFTTRLSASLEGTGPMFGQLAAFALIAVSLGAGARATMLWLDVRRSARAAAAGGSPLAAQPAVPDAAALAAAAAFADAARAAAFSEAARAAAMPIAAMPGMPVAAMHPASRPAAPAPAASSVAGVPPRIQYDPSVAAEPHRSGAAGTGSLLRALVQRVRRPATVRVRSHRGRRPTPQSVRQLAESGAARPEIARRTGLSQDAVGLALHLGGRQV